MTSRVSHTAAGRAQRRLVMFKNGIAAVGLSPVTVEGIFRRQLPAQAGRPAKDCEQSMASQ